MSKQTGLGKGFGSLLSSDFDESILLDKKDRTQKLFISHIIANEDQPRKHFDEASLKELAASIKQYGILQPLVVTPQNDKYIIVAGERRYRAAKLAGLDSVPALVRTSEELERLEIGLVENVQRVDLSPLEQAVSIAKLHEQFNMSYDQIAKRLGKASVTVQNTARLLQLPEIAKEALRKQQISEGHARSVLAIKDYPDYQERLVQSIIQHKWSVRRAEQFANEVKQGTQKKLLKQPLLSKDDVKYSENLQKHLGSKVSIVRSSRGGRLQVFFKSDTELKDIITKITN
mgnify:CR=1 FL=1